MKLLSNSGGALQFIEILQANYTIINDFDYKPDVIGGSSSGTLAAVVASFSFLDHKIWEWAFDQGINVRKDVLFPIPPYNDKGAISLRGGIRGLINLILGSRTTGIRSLGKQDVRSLIGSYITDADFQEWKISSAPNVYACMVNPSTWAYELVDLKTLELYEEFLDVIAASSAIPVTTQPIKIFGEYFVDGGLAYHNPGGLLLDRYQEAESYVGVYSRGSSIEKTYSLKWVKNLWRTFLNSTDAMIMRISALNEEVETLKCLKYGIIKKHVFLPEKTAHLYDTNANTLKSLQAAALRDTNRYMNEPWV